MEGLLFLLEILLLVLGLAIIVLAHLAIPLYLIKKGKAYTYSTKEMWIASLVGGLLGFVVCAVLTDEFRGFLGILQSGFWTLVNYTILYRKSYHSKKKG